MSYTKLAINYYLTGKRLQSQLSECPITKVADINKLQRGNVFTLCDYIMKNTVTSEFVINLIKEQSLPCGIYPLVRDSATWSYIQKRCPIKILHFAFNGKGTITIF